MRTDWNKPCVAANIENHRGEKTAKTLHLYRDCIAVARLRDQILAIMLDISARHSRHIEQSARGYCR